MHQLVASATTELRFDMLLVCAVIESRSMPAPINANTASASTRDASARMGKALQYRAARGSSAAASDDDGPATVGGDAAVRAADGGEFSDLLARMQAASAAGMTLETNNGGLTNGSNGAHEQSPMSADQQVRLRAKSAILKSAQLSPANTSYFFLENVMALCRCLSPATEQQRGLPLQQAGRHVRCPACRSAPRSGSNQRWPQPRSIVSVVLPQAAQAARQPLHLHRQTAQPMANPR